MTYIDLPRSDLWSFRPRAAERATNKTKEFSAESLWLKSLMEICMSHETWCSIITHSKWCWKKRDGENEISLPFLSQWRWLTSCFRLKETITTKWKWNTTSHWTIHDIQWYLWNRLAQVSYACLTEVSWYFCVFLFTFVLTETKNW